MTAIKVYDPAMCCATGVCGTDADDTLAQFAAALDKAKKSGVSVDRFTLAHQPEEYVKNTQVKGLLDSEGIDCLPLVFVGDELMTKGDYPSRAALLGKLGIDAGAATTEEPSSCCGPTEEAETSSCCS